MMFSIKGVFSKCDQIRRKLRIWSQLAKKSLTENFIFCPVQFMTLIDFSDFEQVLQGQWFETIF